jgi:hypothetical protein
MTTIKTRRYAALLAVAFLTCTLSGITKVSYAQPNWPCLTCLSSIGAVDSTLCQSPPDPCIGCHTWALLNNCLTCIDSIEIQGKAGLLFTTCCAAVQKAAWETWVIDSVGPGDYKLKDTLGECLAPQDTAASPPASGILQISTCGLVSGDKVIIRWWPADSPCTQGAQDEIVVVP